VNHEFWYLSRAAGFTAYALLFVSVALGISIGTRLAERFARRNTIFDLHRFTTILALLFTLLHVYVLLADGYFKFNVWQLSIPFLSPYRGWQTAAGVLSLYALILLIASFYARKYIGYRAWRALHFLTFALFAAATLHGITAGTDTTQGWAKALYLVCGGSTVALTMYRVQYRVPDNSAVRTLRLTAAIGTGATALLLAFGTGLFTAANPSSAASAGIAAAPPAAPMPTAAAFPFLASFDDDFSGTFEQSRGATGSHLTLNGTTSGDLAANVRIELTSEEAVPTPDNEDGEQDANDDEDAEQRPRAVVTLNRAQLLDPASNSVICDGRLTRMDDGYMRLACDGAGPYIGVRITVASRVRTNPNGSFTGALSGQMRRMS